MDSFCNSVSIEAINKSEVKALSDSQIINNLNEIRSKTHFLYSSELSRLEKNKTKAIIKNISEFKEIQMQYNQVKKLSPLQWINSLETYILLQHEAEKRKLSL